AGRSGEPASTAIRCCGRCSGKTGAITGSRPRRGSTDEGTSASRPPLRRPRHRIRPHPDGVPHPADVRAAGPVHRSARPVVDDGGSALTISAIARPLVGAGTGYFLLNTGLVATAIALSTRTAVISTWHNNFLWSAPSYFVGAGSAAFAAWFVTHAGYWVAPFT